MKRNLYLLGAILGVTLPYAFFVPFLLENGPDVGLFAAQMVGTPIAAFFVMDVVVSSLVLWVFIFTEGRRLGMEHLWVYVVCNLLVGVSLALPLFLYFREGKLAAARQRP